MKIVLIGFMGAGKTTVGLELHKILNWPLIEMDQEILKMTAYRDMMELFKDKGEIFLREKELELTQNLGILNDVIIATGGGVVLNKLNLDYLGRTSKKIIYLSAKFNTVFNRLKKDSAPRPLFSSIKNLRSLYFFRKHLYKRYADLTISTDKLPPPLVAQKILKKLNNIRQ